MAFESKPKTLIALITVCVQGTFGQDGDLLEAIKDDQSVSGSGRNQSPLTAEPERVDARRRGNLN